MQDARWRGTGIVIGPVAKQTTTFFFGEQNVDNYRLLIFGTTQKEAWLPIGPAPWSTANPEAHLCPHPLPLEFPSPPRPEVLQGGEVV